MEFLEYQRSAAETAIYPGHEDPDDAEGLVYVALGLAGEAGEAANKVKKILRDEDGVITAETRLTLGAELGDVLWYLAAMATQLTLDLNVIARANLRKLEDRAARGVLQGSGDDR